MSEASMAESYAAARSAEPAIDDPADWGCPPHIFVLCALCGWDVCDDCGVHVVEGTEEDECPESTDTSS